MQRRPEEVRRSPSVNPEAIERIHSRLSGVAVVLDPDPDAAQLRALFAEIRSHRNAVARIVGVLAPKLAVLRADLVRMDQVIDGEGAEILAEGSGRVAWAKNAQERTSVVKQMLSFWHEARAAVRADLHVVEEALAHAKWTKEELRFAFEEASRSLASIEFEYRVTRGAP